MGFPQYPQAMPPQYPAAQPYPAPPQYPQYQAPPAPPAAPVPSGNLDDFFGQPSTGGGPSLKFHGKPIGTSYSGIVARQVTNSDVRAQTDQAGRPQTYRDGRPKFVMVVPLLVQPTQEYPEGTATLWVKGQMRDELVRAMAEAGAPEGPPEAGAAITVTLVGQRPVPGMNPQYQYRVEYRRPDNAAPVEQPPAQAQPPAAPAQAQPPATPPAAPAQPAAPAVDPANLTPEQQQLLARLTGGS